jgi:hypothetical protein
MTLAIIELPKSGASDIRSVFAEVPHAATRDIAASHPFFVISPPKLLIGK